MRWRRKWQPTPVFLPAEFHGQGSLVGYSLWDCRIWQDWAHSPHTHSEEACEGSWWPGAQSTERSAFLFSALGPEAEAGLSVCLSFRLTPHSPGVILTSLSISWGAETHSSPAELRVPGRYFKMWSMLPSSQGTPQPGALEWHLEAVVGSGEPDWGRDRELSLTWQCCPFTVSDHICWELHHSHSNNSNSAHSPSTPLVPTAILSVWPCT